MRRLRIPSMVSDLVLTALQLCDGMIFDKSTACPACGGEGTGYDLRKRRFAVTRENGKERVVSVYVKRFQCRQCSGIFQSDAPYYPDTRTGSPVIDLCTTLSAGLPYYRVSAVLEDLGVIVDRGSVRAYALQGRTVRTAEMFGVNLPVSVILLASLEAGTKDCNGIRGSDVIAACGNPSGKGREPSGIMGDSSSPAKEV